MPAIIIYPISSNSTNEKPIKSVSVVGSSEFLALLPADKSNNRAQTVTEQSRGF